MHARLALLSLLLATACTGDAPAAKPAASSSARPSAPPVIVAMDRGSFGVLLYSVGQERKARLVETISPALQGGTPDEVSLSAGARPLTCLVWRDSAGVGNQGSQVWCYPFGGTKGWRVPDTGFPTGSIKLRPDGKALMWVSGLDEMGDQQELVVAALSAGGASGVVRHPLSNVSAHGHKIACSNELTRIAWVDDTRILISCLHEDREGSDVLLQSLSGGATSVSLDEEPPYTSFEFSSADATSALAIQTGDCRPHCDTTVAPSRAVRFDLRTGKVISVIARALSGRFVQSVSGGPRALLYVTSDDEDRRVYVKLPGESKGVLVTGFPLGYVGFVAQP